MVWRHYSRPSVPIKIFAEEKQAHDNDGDGAPYPALGNKQNYIS